MRRFFPRRNMILGATIILAAMLGIAAVCLHLFAHGIVVVVKNADTAPITNVQAFIGGQTLSLGTIASGQSNRGNAVPIADSAVKITYRDAAGIEQIVHIGTYVTPSFEGRLNAEVRGGKLLHFHQDLHVGPF